MLENYASVELDKGLTSSFIPPLAPGMKYTHYAPTSPLVVYTGDTKKVENKILSFINKKIGTNIKAFQIHILKKYLIVISI